MFACRKLFVLFIVSLFVFVSGVFADWRAAQNLLSRSAEEEINLKYIGELDQAYRQLEIYERNSNVEQFAREIYPMRAYIARMERERADALRNARADRLREKFGPQFLKVPYRKINAWDVLRKEKVYADDDIVVEPEETHILKDILTEADIETAGGKVSQALADYIDHILYNDYVMEQLGQDIKALPADPAIAQYEELVKAAEKFELSDEDFQDALDFTETRAQHEINSKIQRDVRAVLRGQSKSEKSDFAKFLELTAKEVIEGNVLIEKTIEYADETGAATAVLETAQDIYDIRDSIDRAKKLDQRAGEDVGLVYMVSRLTALAARRIGGLFGVIVEPYMTVGAKTMEVGVNVVDNARLGANELVPAIGGREKALSTDVPPNRILCQHGKTRGNARILDITVEGQRESLDVVSWQKMEIDGREAWVPCDSRQNPYPYVFFVSSRPKFFVFGSLEMEAYKVKAENRDMTGRIELLAKGDFKN